MRKFWETLLHKFKVNYNFLQISYLYFLIKYFIIRLMYSTLSSTPANLEESWFEKDLTKNFMYKIINLN